MFSLQKEIDKWKKGFAHLEETLINKIRVKIVKACRTELNGGLFRINTVLKHITLTAKNNKS